MHRKDDCIFCKIVAGEMPCFKIHEDEHTLTFLDLFPAAPGHSLIITKPHWDDIFNADPDYIAAVARNSVPLAGVLEKYTNADGLGVHQLNKPAAGQTVFHYHMHLIPAFKGRSLDLHGRSQGDTDELAAEAGEIAALLQQARS